MKYLRFAVLCGKYTWHSANGSRDHCFTSRGALPHAQPSLDQQKELLPLQRPSAIAQRPNKSPSGRTFQVLFIIYLTFSSVHPTSPFLCCFETNFHRFVSQVGLELAVEGNTIWDFCSSCLCFLRSGPQAHASTQQALALKTECLCSSGSSSSISRN